MLPAEMPAVDPSKHRILLVGPRVIHLKPFFERRRYGVVAVQKGVEGMSALDAEPRDIVILELNLGDLTATEFLMAARQAHADASFLLLDDASKAGQIVKALQAGLDGYLPTPPDEDRLFFEVERHLRRAGGGPASTDGIGSGDDTGGFQTTTQLTERPDLKQVTDLQTQLADRESQLVEVQMQTDLLNQEIVKLREEAKKLNAVRGALIGQIEGDLDEEQAFRIKERLAMASVLETEADTLREELGGARSVRRELQQEIELLKKRVQDLSDVPEVEPADEGQAERIEELESDNMVLAGRVAELEEELDLTKAEVVALEQKHKDELAPLQREINKLSSDQALKASDDDKLAMEHIAAVAKMENEHKAELQRLKEDHDNIVGNLKEEHEAALKRAVSDVEIERATIKDQIADAVREAVKTKEKEHLEMLGGKEKEIQQKLNAALEENNKIVTERDQAVYEKEEAIAKALDIELVLDELKTKIDYLEGEVVKANARATKAEQDFKKDKVRLIQEKEEVAAGSQQVFERVQRFVDENAALKKQNAELESIRAALEERAKRGDEAATRAEAELAQTSVIRAEAIQQRDTAEGAKRAIEDRLQTIERQLGERVAQLEAAVEEERTRRENAERALADAGEAANRLADARAAANAAEQEAQRLQQRIDDAERLAGAAKNELELVRTQSEQQRDAALSQARADHERELARVRSELEEARMNAEHTAVQARADLDRALSNPSSGNSGEGAVGTPDALVDELKMRLAVLEDRLLDSNAQARDAKDARDAAQSALNDVERSRAELEARLQNMIAGGGGGFDVASTQALQQERDAYRARLAETEAWVQQAQLHLEALRVERDQLVQQATALSNDQVSRGSEAQELYAQLSNAKQHVEQLTGRAAGLEQELAMVRQQAQNASLSQRGNTQDAQTIAILQDEVKNLRAQLMATQQQVQRGGGGRLPEELEPLRWTLTAAIDALTSLEQREPALASHLRNLRLLATTLQKLSG
jgi:DNA-binding response OmpR family regulator